jgi:hypothetical protein
MSYICQSCGKELAKNDEIICVWNSLKNRRNFVQDNFVSNSKDYHICLHYSCFNVKCKYLGTRTLGHGGPFRTNSPLYSAMLLGAFYFGTISLYVSVMSITWLKDYYDKETFALILLLFILSFAFFSVFFEITFWLFKLRKLKLLNIGKTFPVYQIFLLFMVVIYFLYKVL